MTRVPAMVAPRVSRSGIPLWARYGTDVARAVGIAAAQLDCPADDAFRLLRERAAVSRRPLEELAVAVIDREIYFRKPVS